MGRGALIGRPRTGLRRHRGFGTLLVLAAGLRAIVLLAYRPALIFPDSVRYLQYAQHFADGRWTVDGLRQSGYSIPVAAVLGSSVGASAVGTLRRAGVATMIGSAMGKPRPLSRPREARALHG